MAHMYEYSFFPDPLYGEVVRFEVRPGGIGENPAVSAHESSEFWIEFTANLTHRQTTERQRSTSFLPLNMLSHSPGDARSAVWDMLAFVRVRPQLHAVAVVNEILGCCERMAWGAPACGRVLRVSVVVDLLVHELPVVDFGGDIDGSTVRFVAAREEAIAGLEKIRVRVSEMECVVCLEDILVGSEATRLPCSHQFHGDCIIKWLNTCKSCPLCRFQLPS